MWALKNRTSYAGERTWLRDRAGRHLWLVVVKATFVIEADGRVRLADDQPPVRRVGEHYGDPATTGLRYEAELVHPKPTTDALVNSTAYAPGGKAVPVVPVQVRIDEIRKQLVVYGPRSY